MVVVAEGSRRRQGQAKARRSAAAKIPHGAIGSILELPEPVEERQQQRRLEQIVSKSPNP